MVTVGMEVGPFDGFPETAPAFFVGLAADNTRDYWQANRDAFERDVRAPMTALVAALGPRFGPLRLFRLNRDVRFSRDKSPYKTQLGAVGDRPQGGAWYVHLDADGLLLASGYHMLERDQLDRFRTMVADDRHGPTLVSLIDQLDDAGIPVGHGLEAPLKTAPRGYAKDHPRIGLLRWKGMSVSHRIDDPAALASPALVDEVARFWGSTEPLLQLLDRHVGPSELPNPFDRSSPR